MHITGMMLSLVRHTALALILSAVCCSAATRFFEQDQAFLEPVSYTLDKKGYPFPDLPFAGNGTCEEPVQNLADGTTTVRCLGPAHPLKPGQTVNTMMYLESPYKTNGKVEVINMTAQLVDAAGNPVPLSDVYVHHYVSSSKFILGSGAELRGSFHRKPLASPYALVVDTEDLKNDRLRFTNIQLINTLGVAEADKRKCLECWCKDNPDHGSFFCCQDCPAQDGPSVDYHLEYVVTYRPLSANSATYKQVEFIGFDITGNKIEYDITSGQGPNTTLRKVWDTVIDERCPQTAPFEIVRCTAHQHVGSQCMYLYNLDKDELICQSCPVYGAKPGMPGDEEGYVVAMTDGEPSPVYTVEPGTRVRLISDYAADERRLGIMGLMSVWVAGLSKACTGQFGYSYPMPGMMDRMTQPSTPVHAGMTWIRF